MRVLGRGWATLGSLDFLGLGRRERSQQIHDELCRRIKIDVEGGTSVAAFNRHDR